MSRHRSPPSSLVCVVGGGVGRYLPVGWARTVHVDCIPHLRYTAPASSLLHGCCNCYSLLPPLGCMGCSLRLATPIPTLPGRALTIPARYPKFRLRSFSPFLSTLPCCAQAPKRQLLEGEYKLVCVRGRRRVGREDEYLCVWDGYGPHGDTWEPESHLGKSQRLINALEREVSVKLDRSRFLVQDAIARQLTVAHLHRRDRTGADPP